MPHPEKSARNRNIQKVIQLTILVALLVFSPASPAYAAACTATTSGNWSSAGTWSCGHVPTSSDDVMIGNGLTVTVDIPASVNSLTLNNGNASTALTISGTNSLNVTGDVTLINSIINGTNKVLTVGAGTLNIGGNLNLNTGGGTQVAQMTIGTGTVAVNGNITATGGASARVVFSGAGTLNVAGVYPAGTTLTTAGAGTVNFTGGAQTIPAYTYYNLGLSGIGTKTLPAANLTVGGNLIVGDGTTLTNTTNNTLTVTGTSTVNGNVNLTGTGTKTFTGSVMINNGGVWTESSTGAFFFSGDFTNDGSYTANAATHTFNGTGGKTIGGMNAITIPTATFSQNYTNNGTLASNTLTVSVAAMRLTNNGTVTVNTSLAGAGGVTQGTNSVLNIGAASGITTLTATAAGNTVNYMGAAAQTVKATTYAYLILSGNGVKSLPAATAVNTNLNIIHSGGATTFIAAAQTLAVNSLAFDGIGKAAGTWGGTGSGATNIDSTYFAPTTGRLNVAFVDTRTVPTITFGAAPTPTYQGGPFTVSATTTNTDSSTLVYSVVSGPCVLVGGNTFNSTAPGTCLVQAYGAPTTNFAAATATQSITIAKANQAPLFVTARPAVVVQGFTTTLSSNGGSGTGVVSYSVGSSTGCTVAGNIVTVTDASGTCSVTATKAADSNYLAATSAPLTITLATYQAEINKDFTPTNILPGGISHLNIKVYNPNAFALQNVAWADNLIGVQPGIRLASIVNLANDCGGTVTALPSGTTVSLSGGSVPAKVGTTNGVCTVTVDVTSTTAGNLINTIPAGTLSATDGSGKQVTNTSPASATLQVNTIIAPTINKSFGTPTIWAGQNSLLIINLLNQDPSNALTGVSVTDTLPENVVISNTVFSPALTNCGSGTLTAVPGTRTITLNSATIAAGVGTFCRIQVNTTSSIQGSFINAIPAGAVQTAQGVTNAQQAQATLNVQQVNLTKAFSASPILPGGTTNITITLQNPTGIDYTNAGLTDNLPAGLTYTSLVSNTCGGSVTTNAGNTQMIFSGGMIPHYVSPTPPNPFPRTCSIVFTVTASQTAGGTLTNTIPAGSLTDDQNISNPTTVSASVVVNGYLTVGKSIVPAFVLNGAPSTVTITLNNSNPTTDITGVQMTDTLPANLTVSGSPASPQCSGAITNTANSVTLTGGTIPHGSSCTVVFQVSSTTNGVYTNTIPIGGVSGLLGGTAISNYAAAQATLNVVASSLPVTGSKTFAPSGFSPSGGTNSTLTINLRAPADTSLTSFNVTDNLPAGVTISNVPAASKNANCSGGTLTAVTGTSILTWIGGSINANATCTITVGVTSSTSGFFTNTINPGDISNSEVRTLSNPISASLSVSEYTISKSFTPTTVNQNGLSRLRITLTNQYTTALTNVRLTDDLTTMGVAPNNVLVAPTPNVSNNGCGGTVTANAGASVITLTGGSVLAKVGPTDGLCYIEVDVQAFGAAGSRTNTIPLVPPIPNVLADIPGKTDISPRLPATAILTVAPLSITVNKSFFPLTVFGGSASTLTVTLTNPNNAQLSGIAFTDNLPSGMYIALPANLNTGTCGGTLSGNPSDTSFSYSGGTLAATTTCNLTLSVSTNVSGNLTNIIPINAVTSFNGARNPQATQASLTNLGGVSVDKIFETNPITIGDTSILRIRVTNSSNFTLTNLGLADTLPPGLVIAASPAPTNGCGGALSAPVGTQTISLATGSVAASGLCDITVPVTGSVPGSYPNIIPINTITNTQGNSNTEEAKDTLIINPASPTITTTASPTTGTVGVNIASVGDSATIAGGYNPTGSVTFTLYSDDTCTTAVPGVSGSGSISGNSASWSTSWTPSAAGTYYWQASYSGDTNNNAITSSCTDANEQIVIGSAASLGDFVWNDLNANGIQDAGEPGITGVTVHLLDASGTAVMATTTTDGSGNYLFSGLVPGDYRAEFILPPGYTFSPQDQGTNDALDSDADTTSGRTVTTTLIAGENDMTWDAGMYQSASLGDFVWNDLNANGIQDAGEPGITGVTVHLLDATGTSTLATTSTDSNGHYLFNNLTPGDYRVEFVLPSGYTFSPQDQGANDAVDSDANTSTGRTVATTLTSGENDLTWDAGMYQSTSLGDFVWNDLNANGIQDAGEPGIPNVTVNLLDGAGITILATTTTDGSGNYLFSGLAPGDYRVEFVLPSSYTFSPQDQGANDAVDSDANTSTGRTITTTLISGEDDLTWDAGMYQSASLGDFVWNDLNANGIQDAGEPGIPNVTVNLLDGAGTSALATTSTDSNGHYLFTNLTPGDYRVEFVLPSGYTFSPQDQGANDAEDSDANTSTGRTVATTLTSGENDMTWDAGMFISDMTVIKTISAISYVNPTEMRLTYTITISNPTGTDLSNIQATDDLQVTFGSTPFAFVSLSATNLTSSSTYDGVGDINLLTGSDALPAGGSGTLTLVVDVETGGNATTFTNTVIVTGEPPFGPPLTRTSSVTGPVFADPAVTKVADTTLAMVGDEVTFTITVTNAGNQTATGVTVTDPLPANMDVVTANSTAGTVNIIPPRTVEVVIGDVAVGDVITIAISARINSLGTPPVQNVVTLTTTSSTDILSNDESAVTLDIISPDLPSTGFAPGHQTSLPTQPESKAYLAYDGLTLNIPGLRITLPIVGVPKTESGWDVTWLDKNAGWLNGTAFPTWNGNSVITGHVYLSNGLPGPFVNIDKLKYGDQIIINAFGKKYIYEVRSVSTFKPDNTSKVLQHEDNSWITLLTCKDYDVRTNTYHNRVAVKAVLVKLADK